jgi:hypothetical protein
MSHWLASSITGRSKKPASKGRRPRAESEVIAQQGRILDTLGRVFSTSRLNSGMPLAGRAGEAGSSGLSSVG